MSGVQNIGNLAAIITGEATQIMGVLNQVQGGIDKLNKKVAEQAPITEKAATKAGLSMMGLHAVFNAGAREVMQVIQNIERIPGISGDTMASVRMFKGELAGVRNQIDGMIAKGVAGFADFATALGASLGGVAGGQADMDAAMKAMHDDLERNIRLTPEYRKEVEALGEQIRKLEQERKTLYGGKGFQLKLLEDQAAGAKLATRNFDPGSIEAMKLLLEASQKQLSADRGILELKRELANEQEKGLQLEIRAGEATLTNRAKLEAVLKRETVVWNELNEATKEWADTQDPRTLELMVRKRKELNSLLAQQASLEAKIGEVARDVGDAVGTNFENAIMQGKKLGEMMRSLSVDIAQIVLHRLVTLPIANAITGAVSGAITSFGGFFAEGGDPPVGVPSIVGEEGPEVFVPKTSGTVIPNSALRGMGAGSGRSGPTVNIDARGADRGGLARLEAMIREINGTFNMRAMAAVADGNRRRA